jgi:hypothetical protein
MISYNAQEGLLIAENHWLIKSVRDINIIKRANAHMDGATYRSPFCSTCTNVSELVKFGHSGGLRDVIFGVDKPTHRAPHIVEFEVPDKSFITPQLIREILPQTDWTLGLARAERETEVLYFGDDLSKYLRNITPNPYTNDSFKAVIANLVKLDEQEKAEIERREMDVENRRVMARVADRWPLEEINMIKVKKDIAAFIERRNHFLITYGELIKTNGIDKTQFESIHDKSMQLALRKAIDGFEADIRAKATQNMKDAWLDMTKGYRA